jgi:hypothetical protein
MMGPEIAPAINRGDRQGTPIGKPLATGRADRYRGAMRR